MHLLELDLALLAAPGIVERLWRCPLHSSSRGSESLGCHVGEERVGRVSEVTRGKLMRGQEAERGCENG